MSLGAPAGTVVISRGARVAPMTWADIMADRVARGLESAPAPKSPRARKAPTPAPRVDRRDPSNTAPHLATVYSGPPPKTPAAAAKIRRLAMQACPCRLCALALNPPATFEEQARLIGTIDGPERGVHSFPELMERDAALKSAAIMADLEASKASGDGRWTWNGTSWCAPRGEGGD